MTSRLLLSSLLLMSSLAGGSVIAQEVREPQAVTLDEALRIALRRNPLVDQAQDRIARAQALVGQSRSTGALQIGAAGSWTYQGPNPTILLPGEPGQPPQEIRLGVPRTRTARVTGSQIVDIVGKLRSSTEIARRGVNVSRYDLDRTWNQLVLDVQNAYYSALRAKEIVRVSRDAVAAAEEHRRIAQAQVQAGAAPEFDVLRASVQVANLQQNLVTAESQAGQALVALKNLMGLDPGQPLDVVPVAPLGAEGSPGLPALQGIPGLTPATGPPVQGAGEPAPSAGPPAPEKPGAPSEAVPPVAPETAVSPQATPVADVPQIDVTALLQEAYRTRPELLQADESVRLSEANVKLQRKGRLPDLSLAGSYNLSPDSAGFSPITESWSVGANLSWSLWDGGLTRERVREAKADLELARDTREQVRQAVGAEVQAAVLNLRDALQRQGTARANVVQAREALRIARVRYENGVSTGVEVTDAEVALTQAETNAVNADYDILTAQAALEKALGRSVAVARAALEGGRG